MTLSSQAGLPSKLPYEMESDGVLTEHFLGELFLETIYMLLPWPQLIRLEFWKRFIYKLRLYQALSILSLNFSNFITFYLLLKLNGYFSANLLLQDFIKNV